MSATARVAPAIAFIVACLGIALFSTMDAVMKGLVLAIGAWNTMFWRSLIGVPLSAMAFALGGPRWPARSVLRVHVERGLVSTVMALLFFWGLARVPMAQAIALTFIAPIIALFLAGWALGERIGRSAILGTALAFAGVLLIVGAQARADLGPDALAGTVAILLSACCYAWNIILMRRQALVAKPAEIAFAQNLVVTIALACAAPWLAMPPAATHWPALLLAAVLALGSLFLLGWAYARAEASYLAPVEYSAFLWASLFGWLVFGERVGLWTAGGAALIIAGCIVAARRRHPVADLEAQL
ncbi:DMT family transporter [Sphingomonas sp. 1P06PA]|uniref:DMT family transporter n=1 Tax=Sphingomonas sp. 1P06PA TaxID=554121 RepID=UPI0039A5B3AD